ncbi:MAG TPA: acetylglutamate kinase [Candidatus Fimivivens sp.]|nr:acetylglutamate kinase [Candidatus Fimivivens sp.]
MAENDTASSIILGALKNVLRFRNSIFVTKLSGSVVDHEDRLAPILKDIDLLSRIGIRQIVVHGAGNAISTAMKSAGLDPVFLEGKRVTDERVMRIVQDVLTEMNRRILDSADHLDSRFVGLEESGCRTEPVFTAVQGDPRFGFVGKVDNVDTQWLTERLAYGMIPVFPSFARGMDGQPYNINADDMASAIALALGAKKLIYVSDVPGVMDGDRLIGTLDKRSSEDLIAQGVISGGMIPKVRSIFETIGSGVQNVHLVDGTKDRSLLLEIMTEAGTGTMFSL